MARAFLKDEEWKKIEPLLPSQKGKRGRPRKNDREMIEAILWILRTGTPWRDLPLEFGSWKSVYWRFHYWTEKGIWQKIWFFLKNRCKPRMPYY